MMFASWQISGNQPHGESMDPNANLKEQIEICKRILAEDVDESDAPRLADLVLALNEWIAKGGFLPSAWAVTR